MEYVLLGVAICLVGCLLFVVFSPKKSKSKKSKQLIPKDKGCATCINCGCCSRSKEFRNKKKK